MAGPHLAVVSAKKKAVTHGPGKHKSPVHRVHITKHDNGGFTVDHEMHPTGGQTANEPYSPGTTHSAAFTKAAPAMKHVAGLLKTDAEEQGPGEGAGGDPGSSEEAE